MNILANDALRFRSRPRDVARHLRVVVRDASGAEAERSGIFVARLLGETRPVDGASIQSRRSAGLEATSAESEFLEGFAE